MSHRLLDFYTYRSGEKATEKTEYPAECTFVLSKSSLANDLTMPKAAPLPRGHAAKFGITLLACRLEGPLPLLVLT